MGIEPDGQTALLEATLAVPGVLIAGVPGAGGHGPVLTGGVDRSSTWFAPRLVSLMLPSWCPWRTVSGILVMTLDVIGYT